MSFIPGGTSRLYREEISEPDHFRCTQENPQHECSCPSARTFPRRDKVRFSGPQSQNGYPGGAGQFSGSQGGVQDPAGNLGNVEQQSALPPF